ncbi:MAG: SCP2 sterol-binding domain-containing protein [Pseudomonadales bacterium]|nr:SCP2 sterol-binding domain-containing protein [Pseudomonadales bacterium]
MTVGLLDAFAAALLDGTLAQLLRTDPATAAELRALGPARLHVALERPPLRLALVLGPERARIEAGDADDAADATVRLTSRGLADLLAGERERALLSGGVATSGDVRLVERTFAILARFRPDFATPLARLVGDVPVATAGAALREGAELARGAAREGGRRLRERITGVGGLVPERAEVARFLDEVDDLRLATDRLEARVRRLEARRGAAPTSGEGAP